MFSGPEPRKSPFLKEVRGLFAWQTGRRASSAWNTQSRNPYIHAVVFRKRLFMAVDGDGACGRKDEVFWGLPAIRQNRGSWYGHVS